MYTCNYLCIIRLNVTHSLFISQHQHAIINSIKIWNYYQFSFMGHRPSRAEDLRTNGGIKLERVDSMPRASLSHPFIDANRLLNVFSGEPTEGGSCSALHRVVLLPVAIDRKLPQKFLREVLRELFQTSFRKLFQESLTFLRLLLSETCQEFL